jgi:hypothetical protein
MVSTTIPVNCTGNYRTRNQQLATSAPVAPSTPFVTINQHAAKNEPSRAVAKTAGQKPSFVTSRASHEKLQ